MGRYRQAVVLRDSAGGDGGGSDHMDTVGRKPSGNELAAHKLAGHDKRVNQPVQIERGVHVHGQHPQHGCRQGTLDAAVPHRVQEIARQAPGARPRGSQQLI